MSYQRAATDIEGAESNHGVEQVETIDSQGRKSRWVLGVIGGCAMLGLVFGVLMRSGKQDLSSPPATLLEPSKMSVPTLGSPHVRECTFGECAGSNCNHEVAPFTCLFHNGGVHGGCSGAPWMVPETCTEQCNLSKCDEQEIPSDQPDCSGDCSEEWCKVGRRLCPEAAKYQCMVGSAAYGCSADSYQWTFRTSGSTCSSCCDATTCE